MKKSIYLLITIFVLAFGLYACKDEPIFTYYTVTFDTLGGSEVESIEVLEGNTVPQVLPTTRENYTFIGWFKSVETNEENRWNFSTDRVTQNITLYAGWLSIEEIDATESLTYVLTDEGYVVTGVGDEVSIIIPEEYNGQKVIAIGEAAFARKQIVSVIIPDSVEAIGLNAFHNCSYLETVTIGENSSLTTIANNAFSGNSSLKQIFIPKGMTNLGDAVFNNCGALEVINVDLDNEAFYSTGNNLIERSTQTLIRGSNNSVIPSGVLVIGEASFRRSTITSIEIPETVATIENYAFDDCESLEEIIVSSNNLSFASMDKILYDKGLTTIIEVPTSIKGEINLPSTLLEIPMFAFDGRSELSVINIPSGDLLNIRNFAFRGTSLTINYLGTEAKWNEIAKASLWGQENVTVNFQNEEIVEDDPKEDEEINDNEEKKILIVYFSYSNNTEAIANYLAAATKGTLVEIIPLVPYTQADTNYNDSSSRSQVERRNNSRPEILGSTYEAINIDEYDTIFIGYPIWNGYEPMIIRTFIDHYNGLENKTIYTFSTSASSSGSTAFNSIKSQCQNAEVVDNIHFTSSTLRNGEALVNSWVDSLNLVNDVNTLNVYSITFKQNYLLA